MCVFVQAKAIQEMQQKMKEEEERLQREEEEKERIIEEKRSLKLEQVINYLFVFCDISFKAKCSIETLLYCM
jgi:histidinol-phosphate/aromatic aminotransferase/cobyric acid decarboxylase-like protein